MRTTRSQIVKSASGFEMMNALTQHHATVQGYGKRAGMPVNIHPIVASPMQNTTV